MSEIKHFRIINTDEIIAEVVKETDTTFVLKKPHIVIELPEKIILSKYVPFAKEQEIVIKKSHVIADTLLDGEMVRFYFNSVMMGDRASGKALEGLAQVNDMMESYLIDGEEPSNHFIEMNDPVFTSNTIH